ncbi:60S ribosomal protein L7-3 [Cyclospora cayetanensis]|uniref:60S ribosomal protein L7-3 n=1 Tax=Cyclospora cayetanensis TaxID=88456 RepID=A0A6P6RYA6_9EIME|nr:60S ribosomal protein L7-3 [Cyclospora cayetanensis]
MVKGTEHLQEAGGARGALRPRVAGESLKVAETILKKRQQDLKEKAKRAKALSQFKRAKKASLHTNKVKSAQHFVKKALLAMQDSKRVRVQRNRKAKQQRQPDCRVYCVVRNHRKGGCRETRKALEALGLSKPYSCTLIPNDETATTTLRKISPFIFYGLPSADTVRRLFLTRARMQSDEGGPPVPLSNNVMIEDAFGSMGILCLEDLVEHILTCGPHFAQLMQKVGKFQLTSLKQVEGLEAKRMEYGFLGDKINIKVTQLT